MTDEKIVFNCIANCEVSSYSIPYPPDRVVVSTGEIAKMCLWSKYRVQKAIKGQDSCGCYELNTYIPPRINPKQYPNGYWGEVGTVYFDYFDVEAWCPLPAPYRPEGEEHERFD